jgi:antagonist of KipI
MDKYAMKVGNFLVGNEAQEAVIEMHFPAAVFLFTQPALIALAGADFSASINGEPIPNVHPILVEKNDVLQFHKPLHGARAYLTLSGGFTVPQWMNSSSTNLKAKAGGFRGRALQKNDELLFKKTLKKNNGSSEMNFMVLPWKADTNYFDAKSIPVTGPIELSILPGNEWTRLADGAKKDFLETSFVISQQSDRMGYRLDNIPLEVLSREELVSAAVNFGTIQLLPGGKLIILMADHQTTGGYPRIAHIMTAHHSRLAQLKAGDSIRFKLTTLPEAEQWLVKQEQHLQQLRNACTFRLEEYYQGHG